MRAIITVIGNDRKGIIAGISTELANCEVNILDMNQTILQEFFTMVMLVDLTGMNVSVEAFKEKMVNKGLELGMTVKIQREDLFNAMHRV